MTGFVSLLLLGLLAFQATLSPGLKAPQHPGEDRVVQIGPGDAQELEPWSPHQPPKVSAFRRHLERELPRDDRGRWYITIFVTPEGEQSRRLIRDLQTHPSLRVLAQWADVQQIDFSEPVNRARWREQRVTQSPTILVYPRADHPTLPFRCVTAQQGYGGDAEMLARRIYSAIRTIYQKYGAIEQCPGPWCPSPQPDRPDVRPWEPQPWNPDGYQPFRPDRYPQPAPLPDVDEAQPPSPVTGWFDPGIVALAVVLLCVACGVYFFVKRDLKRDLWYATHLDRDRGSDADRGDAEPSPSSKRTRRKTGG